jgi:hypothetical protein
MALGGQLGVPCGQRRELLAEGEPLVEMSQVEQRHMLGHKDCCEQPLVCDAAGDRRGVRGERVRAVILARETEVHGQRESAALGGASRPGRSL